MINETKTPTLLITTEVCKQLRVTRQTLERWVKLGIAPRPIRIGPNTLRFKAAEIEAMSMRGGALQAAERFGRGGRAAFWSPEIDEQPDDRRIETISENEQPGDVRVETIDDE